MIPGMRALHERAARLEQQRQTMTDDEWQEARTIARTTHHDIEAAVAIVKQRTSVKAAACHVQSDGWCTVHTEYIWDHVL